MSSASVADVLPIYAQRELADPDYLHEVATTKRFLERWMGDDGFRELVASDPAAAAAAGQFVGDPCELAPLWDLQAPGQDSRRLRRYRAFIQEKLEHRSFLRRLAPAHPGLKAWRERQIRRCDSQLGHRSSQALVHPTVAFELQKGCSVGCWFCGISAPKLGDIFRYTPEHARLWQDVLEVVRAYLGPQVHGTCYWATDPLDNPDYERFCLDYHRILGWFPQTTTAQPLKDPERVRALLRLSGQHRVYCDRFSVLTKRQLLKIHETFSPEELAYVELVPQNPESTAAKARAGRALERLDRFHLERERKGMAADAPDPVTIACVSGLLINMVDRNVRFGTPGPASERWPDGFQVRAQGRFDDAAALRELLAEWTDEARLPTRLPLDLPVTLRPDLRVVGREAGAVLLESSCMRHAVPGPRPPLERLASGPISGHELALSCSNDGLALAESLFLLHTLFEHGMLESEQGAL